MTSHNTIRILFIADTHLGIDMPQKPRVHRKRRGEDFFNNFLLALEPAFQAEVDLIVHGGDILYRSRVPAELVYRSFEPLIDLAERGIPVYVVPGNHERSRIPFPLFAYHPNIHIFDRPRTYHFIKNDLSLALAGFPYDRTGVRHNLPFILKQTDLSVTKSSISVLCMHHLVEGAQVGVRNYTFRKGEDVIKGIDIPPNFSVILSGHVHRAQLLTHDLAGFPFASPVLYAGSIERTSFDERKEEKGYMIVEVEADGSPGGRLKRWKFMKLPTRPMQTIIIAGENLSPSNSDRLIRQRLSELNPKSIVRLKITGSLDPDVIPLLKSSHIRSLTATQMNVSIQFQRK